MSIEAPDYPSLLHQSDGGARRAQSTHLAFLWGQLGLLAASSFLGVGSVLVPAPQWAYTAVALLLASSALLGLLDRAMSLQAAWFDCRAVAESAKTLSWRYMMGSAPYHRGQDERAVDTRFAADLLAVVRARPGVETHFAGTAAPTTYITDSMRQLRRRTLAERKTAYLGMRLDAQKGWYGEKAERCRLSGRTWTCTSLTLQGLAVLAVISFRSLLGACLVSAAATLASASVAWFQTRRFEEFASAYALAAQELDSLRPRLEQGDSEEALSESVVQVEETISREHTMWIARRTA